MDAGHHNCRDYYLKPEDAIPQASKPTSIASVLAMRAVRSSQKSPLNGPIRRSHPFPFLELPFELRRQIYSYLLPCTGEQRHSRNHFFKTITSKRIPPTHHNLPPAVLQELLAKPAVSTPKDSVTWLRGQISLLAVSHQFHDECAELMYGESTFVIFIAYDTITFRFRWSLPNGLTPSKPSEFLDLISPRYLKLIKRLIVTVDHVDSYTGQIKYNVGGKGLTYGLRGQVARLVEAVKTVPEIDSTYEVRHGGKDNSSHGLKRLTVNLLNGNDHLDAEKRNMVKAKGSSIGGNEEVQTVLEPLMDLEGLVSLEVTGAVTDGFVEQFRTRTLCLT